MAPYLGHLISVLIMLGGLVGVYVKIMARLTKIETRLEIDDRGRSQRDELYAARAREAAARFCREECPRAATTNPRIPVYNGPIMDDR